MNEKSLRAASCPCGQLRATVTGDPGRVSVCHCQNCQQRSGSAFAWQARWPEDQVTIEGEFKTWQRAGDEGGIGTFSFCPDCGATVFYVIDAMPGQIAIPLGALAGQDQPAPKVSVYENRLQPWVAILGDAIERY
jgi:hypothetical protein